MASRLSRTVVVISILVAVLIFHGSYVASYFLPGSLRLGGLLHEAQENINATHQNSTMSLHMAFGYPTGVDSIEVNRLGRVVSEFNFCFNEIWITVDWKEKAKGGNPFDDPQTLSLNPDWIAVESKLQMMLSRAVNASIPICGSSRPLSKLVVMTTSLHQNIAFRAYGIPLSQARWRGMFKNSLMYASIGEMATTDYTFHIDDDTSLFIGIDGADLFKKVVQSFQEVPRMAFLGMRHCTRTNDPTAVVGRMGLLDQGECMRSRCSSSIYVDEAQMHWSLRAFFVDNARFRTLFPFPSDLAFLHIEKLFSVGLMLKKNADRALPTIAGWMSLEDFRICRCFGGCHRWADEVSWTEDRGPVLDAWGWAYTHWVRFSRWWDYYSGQEVNNNTWHTVLQLSALSCAACGIPFACCFVRKFADMLP